MDDEDGMNDMLSFALEVAVSARQLVDETDIIGAAVLFGEASRTYGFAAGLDRINPKFQAAEELRLARQRHATFMNGRSQKVRRDANAPRDKRIVEKAKAIRLANPGLSDRRVARLILDGDPTQRLSESSIRRILSKHRNSN